MTRLRTRRVDEAGDIAEFFDALAGDYRDCHGDAARRLHDRLALIRRLLRGQPRSLLVEIGCGNGMHLFELAGEFTEALGTDLSQRMIASAEKIRAQRGLCEKVRLAAEPAERLSSVPDAAADVVLCVGAFEHMTAKAAVLAEAMRVLRPGGAFVCLTPNGDYVWYTRLAPWMGLETRHLSTDRFVRPREWPALLRAAGLEPRAAGSWQFVPAGDMPRWTSRLLRVLDVLGRVPGLRSLRGGHYVCAIKPVCGEPGRRAGG